MPVIKVDDYNGNVFTYNDSQMIAHGGEASIYVPSGSSEYPGSKYLLKVFTSTDKNVLNEKYRKISAMLELAPSGSSANPYIDGNNNKKIYLAWPEKLVRNLNTGEFIGYLMRKVDNAANIGDLFNVNKMKRKGIRELDIRTKLEIASQLTYIFWELHRKGVSGFDGNVTNYLISRNGQVTLIDCDSFRIDAGRYTYKGDSWTEGYVAPEYINAYETGRSVELSKDGDEYILALFIFKILMDGTDPFSGSVKPGYDVKRYGKGANVSEFRMVRGLYTYGSNNHIYNKRPGSPDANIFIPKKLQKMFIQCFEQGVTQIKQRPKSEEWNQAIRECLTDIANGNLKNLKSSYSNVSKTDKCNPIMLALDVTPSMVNETRAWNPLLEALRSMMDTFKDMNANEPGFDMASVELSVLTYATNVNVVDDFTTLNNALLDKYRGVNGAPISIVNELTNIERVVDTAIKRIEAYTNTKDRLGEVYRKPKLIIFTDGINCGTIYNSSEEFYKAIEPYKRKIDIICVALGQIYDARSRAIQGELLKNISSDGKFYRFENNDELNNKLKDFLRWVSVSTNITAKRA